MIINKFKLWIASRGPSSQDIQAIYGLIVMLIYGWSLYWFVWYFPSWILFLTPGEIWAIYCYTAVINFLESMVILAIIVGLCIVLPGKWMRNDFIWHSSSIVLFTMVCIMIVLARSIPLPDVPKYIVYDLIVFIAVQVVSVKTRSLRNFMREFTERSIVFAYIAVPLSLVSLIFVVIRNI